MPLTPETYSLSNLRGILAEARRAEINNVTINVSFKTPDKFSHEWTLQDVETPEQLDEEVEGTIDAAKNRLEQGADKAGISNFDKAWNEIQSGLEVELPDEVLEFVDLKEAEDDIEEAVKMTEELYDQVDRSRSISIQSRVDRNTETISEYKENVEKVEQNLEFEENVNLNEDDSAFEEGRQRTTGELEYFDRDGERKGVLIFSNKVQIQEGGRGGQVVREFENKEKAREYYQEDRLG